MTYGFSAFSVAAATTMPLASHGESAMFMINIQTTTKPRKPMAGAAWTGDNKKPRAISGAGRMVLVVGYAALHGVAGIAFSSVLTLDADTIASRKWTSTASGPLL